MIAHTSAARSLTAAVSATLTAAAIGTLTMAGMALTAPSAPATPYTPPMVRTCDLTTPPRLAGPIGAPLDEDQAPYTGMCGGTLVSFSGDGIAVYSDRTATDGANWTLYLGDMK